MHSFPQERSFLNHLVSLVLPCKDLNLALTSIALCFLPPSATDIVQNLEIVSDIVQNLEIVSDIVQSLEIVSHIVQNPKIISHIVQNPKIVSHIIQNLEIVSHIIALVSPSQCASKHCI